MSSFGCKKPLHHSIISEDVWYPKAFDMVNFLKSYFQSDDIKKYFLGQNTDILKPCRKFQLIAVSKEGQFHRELYLHDLEIPSKMFNENSPIERRLDEGDEVNEYEDVSEPTEHHLHQNAVFEIIKPGTFIWMKPPLNAIKPLFIAEILRKGTAEEDLRNKNGHILEGKMYAETLKKEKK